MKIVNMWNTDNKVHVFLKNNRDSVFKITLTNNIKNNAEELISNCWSACRYVGNDTLQQNITQVLTNSEMLKHLTLEISEEQTDLGAVYRLVNLICKLIISFSGTDIKIGVEQSVPIEEFDLWDIGMRRVSLMIEDLDRFGLDYDERNMLP